MTEEAAPPFGYPTTAEIMATPWNGRTHFGTFTGTGGTSLGYRWAGFRNLGATEFLEPAREAYRSNFGQDALIVPNDVRDVHGLDLVNMARVRWQQTYDDPFPGIDVLDGSPPCSGFSASGKGDKQWGQTKKYSDTNQHAVEDLFFDFIRIVGEAQPRAFTAENVPGLAFSRNRGYLWDIIEAFQDLGYTTVGKILDSQWLAVPQRRRRLFLVGFREPHEAAAFAWPTPNKWRWNVAAAVADAPEPVGDEIAIPFDTGKPDGSAYSIYEAWKSLPLGGSPKGAYFNVTRTDPGRPAPTITATAGTSAASGACHWQYPRKFHIPELKRICGFPDDWKLQGNYSRQAERLGRAVPPPVARALATSVARALD